MLIVENVWVDHFGYFFSPVVAQTFEMVLSEYRYARKFYYPLLFRWCESVDTVFSLLLSFQVIHVLHYAITDRINTLTHTHINTSTVLYICFNEIMAYAVCLLYIMYIDICIRSIYVSKTVLIMATLWQEVVKIHTGMNQQKYSVTQFKRQIESKSILSSGVLISWAVFLWPEIGCSACFCSGSCRKVCVCMAIRMVEREKVEILSLQMLLFCMWCYVLHIGIA